jgi:hypothetical protein
MMSCRYKRVDVDCRASLTNTVMDEETMMGSAAVVSHEAGQNQDNLLLAPQESGTGLILDTGGGDSADTEVRLLLDEECRPSPNLGRMGGKAPKTYIEEARAKKGSKVDESVRSNRASQEAGKAKTRANCQGGSRNRRPQKKMSDKDQSCSNFWKWEMLVFYANWVAVPVESAPTSLFTPTALIISLYRLYQGYP